MTTPPRPRAAAVYVVVVACCVVSTVSGAVAFGASRVRVVRVRGVPVRAVGNAGCSRRRRSTWPRRSSHPQGI
eukprot:jgi/Chrzof1/4923/Cz15g04190.t1